MDRAAQRAVSRVAHLGASAGNDRVRGVTDEDRNSDLRTLREREKEQAACNANQNRNQESTG